MKQTFNTEKSSTEQIDPKCLQLISISKKNAFNHVMLCLETYKTHDHGIDKTTTTGTLLLVNRNIRKPDSNEDYAHDENLITVKSFE